MKSVVFDFGNVIAFFDHHIALARLAPFTSWPAQRILDEILGGPLEDDLESGRLSVDAFLTHFIDRCEVRRDLAFVRAACADIFSPNPEVCALLPLLRGRYRLVLGSNTSALHADRFLVQFEDVLSQFDDRVLSYQIGVRKPRAGFFHECARRAGCEAAECLFVDDLPANIAGAQEVGMHGIVYRPNDDLAGKLRLRGVTL